MADLFEFINEEHETHVTIKNNSYEEHLVITAGEGNVEDAYVPIDDESALKMAYAIIEHVKNKGVNNGR